MKFFLKIFCGLILLASSPVLLAHDNRLCDAIHHKDSKQANALLAQGVNPNDATQAKFPIFCAVDVNSIEMVDLLVQAGALLNVRDALNLTPLMLATLMGYIGVAERLIDLGADVNSSTIRGKTALNIAMGGIHVFGDKQYFPLIEILLAHKANPNVCDQNSGHTPLIGAAIAYDLTSIDLLLKAGADANQSCNGHLPLFFSLAPDERDPDSLIARHLIKAGANIQVKQATGITPEEQIRQFGLQDRFCPDVPELCREH